MQATFTYDGRYTRHLEIPINAERICMAFGWENRSIGSNSRHIQPSNGIFNTLQNGETYEIILPQQRCTFVYNGESINEDINKASQKFLGDKFRLKPDTIILNDGSRDIISTDGLFINLTVGSTYKVISQPRPQRANVRQVKIKIQVPDEFLNDLHGSLMNSFQDYSHINKYKNLDDILKNSEEVFLRANKLKDFRLGQPIEEGLRTFHLAVIEINNAEYETFSTIEQGLAEIKRELSKLPLILLDTIAIPNSFAEDREKISRKMQEDVNKKIQEANTFIEMKIQEIIDAVEKPKELANKLSEIISNKKAADDEIAVEHIAFLKEYEFTLSQLDADIETTENALKEARKEANKLSEGWFSNSQGRYKTTKNIKLEDYIKQLAVLSSPIRPEDHEILQKFREDLTNLEKELKEALDGMEKDGTTKENASRAADCSEKVAQEKINLFEELIRKKKNARAIMERTRKMLDENKDELTTVTQVADVSKGVNGHLANIRQLFGNITAALRLTQEKFEKYLNIMDMEVISTSQEHAQNQMELWYAETIQAIGWIAQICTTCTVFEKLYTEVINPGLQKNTHALYTGEKLEKKEIKSAADIINQLSSEAPKEAVRFIKQIHKPLNVYVGFIKNEPEMKVEEPESEEEKSDDEEAIKSTKP